MFFILFYYWKNIIVKQYPIQEHFFFKKELFCNQVYQNVENITSNKNVLSLPYRELCIRIIELSLFSRSQKTKVYRKMADKVVFSADKTKSDPLDRACLIIGQAKHMRSVTFENVAEKLTPRVDQEVPIDNLSSNTLHFRLQKTYFIISWKNHLEVIKEI